MYCISNCITQIEAAGLSARSSGHLAAGRIRHFPHPRNNEHPLRFSLRNNFGINQNQTAQANQNEQNQPTNEEILQGIYYNKLFL